MAASAVPPLKLASEPSLVDIHSPVAQSESMMDNGLTGRTDWAGVTAAHTSLPGSPPPSGLASTTSPLPATLSALGDLSSPSAGASNLPPFSEGSGSGGESEIDPAILEALRSAKERLYVLKMADAMENLIYDRGSGKPTPRASFQPNSSYQRLLVHRCSAYYKLSPESEQATKAITVTVTVESRIPSRRISELVPAEAASSLPTFKIMRRTTPDQRNKTRTITAGVASSALSPVESSPADAELSSAASVTSPSDVASPLLSGTEVDDPDAAVLLSLGLPPPKARSTTGTTTPRKTIEEREAAYLEAKRRIFSDFPEREKEAARLREDREREREVRELHRELADEEELRTTGVVNGGEPLDGVTSEAISSVPADVSGPAIYYPSLYDTAIDGGNPNSDQPPPHQPGPGPGPGSMYQLDSSIPPYDPNSHYAAPYPHHPYGTSPYPPYPQAVNGMHMTGPPPQAIGPYPAYQNQQAPPPQMQMGVMAMIPYPYYPPPPSWVDGGYSPTGPGMENRGPPGYAIYGVPMQAPQQPSFWAPAPPPAVRQQQPGRQPGEAASTQPQSQPLHPNAPSFVPSNGPHPPTSYYGSPMPQQPYPNQGMRPSLPPHGQTYPFSAPQAHGAQSAASQRQLWTPNNGRKDGQNRNGMHSNGPPRAGASSRPMPPPSLPPSASISPSSSLIKLGLTSPSRSNRNPPRDFVKPSNSLFATPMTGGSTASGSRSRNSSFSSTSARSAMSMGSRVWGSGVLGGMSPVSPNGNSGRGFSSMSSPDPGLEADQMGLGVRMGHSRSMGGRRGSGSLTGSISGSGSNGGESGTRTPLDETASVASSSISSASSSRTFTSTSSKHPSLPPRPDWSMGPMGLIPGPHNLHHSSSSRASISSQSSTRANPRSVSSNNSNPPHSRSHSSQSQPQVSQFPTLQPTDFPPLPGAGSSGSEPRGEQLLMTFVPQGTTVWSGNPRSNPLASESGSSNDANGSHIANHDTTGTLANGHSNGDRAANHSGKFVRPPPKGNAELFNPKHPSTLPSARASTPVATRPPDVMENGATADGALSGSMARLDIAQVATLVEP